MKPIQYFKSKSKRVFSYLKSVPPKPSNKQLILYSCLLLLFLLAASPIKLDAELQSKAPYRLGSPQITSPSNLTDAESALMLEQLKKANIEIQERLNQETSWFQLKYYLVGGLLFGFLTNTFLSKDLNSKDTAYSKIKNALGSPSTSLVLAFGCIVAITIDTQIRVGRNFIAQLGIWIESYVEPLFLRQNLVAWEQFLRLKGAYHVETISSTLVSSSIYILTLILYALYIFSTQKVYENSDTKKASELNVVSFGFWLLQGTIAFCILPSHLVPQTFQVTPFPFFTGWLDIYRHPSWLIPIYVTLWFHSANVVILATKIVGHDDDKQSSTENNALISFMLFTLILLIACLKK